MQMMARKAAVTLVAEYDPNDVFLEFVEGNDYIEVINKFLIEHIKMDPWLVTGIIQMALAADELDLAHHSVDTKEEWLFEELWSRFGYSIKYKFIN